MFLEIGKIKQVTPSEAWGDQIREFVPWLAENLDSLGSVLNLDLERDEAYSLSSGKAMSLVARDRQNPAHKFLIGCWLEPDPAPSMEEIFDQAAEFGVQRLIWVSPDFSDVQLRVLDWLNTHMASMQFYAVGMNLLQIGNSAPALEWVLCCSPEQSANAKNVSVEEDVAVEEAAGDAFYSEAPLAESNAMEAETARQDRPEALAEPVVATSTLAPAPPPEIIHQRFFEGVAEELQVNHNFASEPLIAPYDVLRLPSGQEGISYRCVISDFWSICTQLHIDVEAAPDNEQIFKALKHRQFELEDSFGEALMWEREPNDSVGHVSLYRRAYALELQSGYNDVRNWSVSRLVKFRAVFDEPVAQLAMQPEPVFGLHSHWQPEPEPATNEVGPQSHWQPEPEPATNEVEPDMAFEQAVWKPELRSRMSNDTVFPYPEPETAFSASALEPDPETAFSASAEREPVQDVPEYPLWKPDLPSGEIETMRTPLKPERSSSERAGSPDSGIDPYGPLRREQG